MEATAPRISFHAQTQSLEMIRNFCRNILRNHSQDQQFHRKMVLAIDEAVANVIEHACSNNGGQATSTIELTLEIHPDRLVVQILDQGAPFVGAENLSGQGQANKSALEFENITIPIAPLSSRNSSGSGTPQKSRPPISSFPRRGFGLQIIRLIMDEIEYRRTPKGENLLTLTKRFRKGGSL